MVSLVNKSEPPEKLRQPPIGRILTFDKIPEQKCHNSPTSLFSLCKTLPPEQISGRRQRMKDGMVEQSGVTVSHEAIYRAIYALSRGELRRELISCLRHEKPMRGRKPKGSERRGKLCNMTNIRERPEEIEVDWCRAIGRATLYWARAGRAQLELSSNAPHASLFSCVCQRARPMSSAAPLPER
jgi:hypothetical protein